MTGRKFVMVLGFLFLIGVVVYVTTTPKGNDIPLTGVVDGNTVIVSPQITGRMITLKVDEGSEVTKGELIAELDPKELEANLDAAKANVASLENQVTEANHNYTWTNDQTGASIEQAGARVTSSKAQIEQAQVALARDKDDLARMQKLFAKGEISAQDRDHAEAAVKMSQANVDALEQSAMAEAAALNVAQANRKQVDVRKSEISTTLAQLEQARATEAQVATQLGYTKIYAPIDGIVSVRVAKQGEVVSEGSPIVVLVDVNHLWVRADVEETYIDSIQFGQKLRVQLPSGDVREGDVFFKGVEGDYATQRDVSRTKRDIKTFAIKVSLPNPEHRLFMGMTATVLLPPPAQKKNWYDRL
ncbi:MAG TPA: efflux RND transporter periplasmic adaptor subunit [Candidatus Acidoferrales bacterium]|jgi:HlyD family secretion protein|nr:efflux RND transporter periplasmic adaptor subunit [Candidatus Acidoferrales bacterium]